MTLKMNFQKINFKLTLKNNICNNSKKIMILNKIRKKKYQLIKILMNKIQKLRF